MRQINFWFYIPALLFLAIGAWILQRIGYGDELSYFNPWRHEPYNTFFRVLTASAEGYLYAAIALALLFRRKFRYAFLVIISGLLTMPLVVFVQDIDLNGGYNSFPSGHTMSAFAVYGIVSLMLLRWGRPYWGLLLVFMAIGVGISRIFLVQHFLNDVMAGAASGIVLSLVIWSVNNLFEQYFLKK